MAERGKGHMCDKCHTKYVCSEGRCGLEDHADCNDCYIHALRQKEVVKTSKPLPQASVKTVKVVPETKKPEPVKTTKFTNVVPDPVI